MSHNKIKQLHTTTPSQNYYSQWSQPKTYTHHSTSSSDNCLVGQRIKLSILSTFHIFIHCLCMCTPVMRYRPGFSM